MVRSSAANDEQQVDASGFPKVVVSAVLLNAKSRQAVLNGEVVAEGQQWSGLDVVKIHQQGVVLAKDEKQREYLIHSRTLLKEHANEF